jgi:hypothetical protein
MIDIFLLLACIDHNTVIITDNQSLKTSLEQYVNSTIDGGVFNDK